MAQEQQPTFDVIGSRTLTARLLRDVREGRLNHAYILDGPAGSGRHTVARMLCGAIACGNRPGQVRRDEDQFGMFDSEPIPKPLPGAKLPCGQCPACRKVLAGQCPDIRVIGREGKATLGVDAVRFLRQDVLIPPNDLDTKIYIIEDAETMTVQAQNALLLTLEEPPAYVLFLLLCSGADALLETIRSRAPVLRMQPVPDDTIRQYLIDHKRSLSETDMNAVLSRAQGSIGQAMAMSDARSLKPILRTRTAVDEYVGACAQHRPAALLAAVNGWDSKRDAVADILSGLDQAFRDLLLIKSSETVTLLWYEDTETALELSSNLSQRALLKLIDGLHETQKALDANANVKLTLTRMALDAGLN